MFRRMMLMMRQDWRTRLLLAESFFYLGWARYQMLQRPFAKLTPTLGVYMAETSHDLSVRHLRTLKHVRSAIGIASKYTLWESKCFVRAIAALKMLERRKIECTLYLGTAKDQEGKMIAHAWLRSGSLYITGEEEMRKFTVTGMFGCDPIPKNGT